MTSPTEYPRKEGVDRVDEQGNIESERSASDTESAEEIGRKEAKLTLLTLVFFGVPLLIASVQITVTYFLAREFDLTPDNGSATELAMLHWGALVVTLIGLVSAVGIVLTSSLRILSNLTRTAIEELHKISAEWRRHR